MASWGRLFWRAGTGMWLGVQLLLFMGIAPTVFRTLPESQAGRFLQGLFPSYYGLGLVLGALWLLGGVMMASQDGHRRRWWLILLALANWLIIAWAERLLPAMNQVSASSATFHALHQRSVALSVVSFLLSLGGMAWESLRDFSP
jgi:hypothetical protein